MVETCRAAGGYISYSYSVNQLLLLLLGTVRLPIQSSWLQVPESSSGVVPQYDNLIGLAGASLCSLLYTAVVEDSSAEGH